MAAGIGALLWAAIAQTVRHILLEEWESLIGGPQEKFHVIVTVIDVERQADWRSRMVDGCLLDRNQRRSEDKISSGFPSERKFSTRRRSMGWAHGSQPSAQLTELEGPGRWMDGAQLRPTSVPELAEPRDPKWWLSYGRLASELVEDTYHAFCWPPADLPTVLALKVTARISGDGIVLRIPAEECHYPTDPPDEATSMNDDKDMRIRRLGCLASAVSLWQDASVLLRS
ncbi:hypothetical protein BO94DRAFT_546732 [Aspergillus sclerotioniger CBS 115572]|uniref:Uncharacterized protein n=1 Tax=Aspergillus sclerotioniger CBS 115572 TaxID=1450535 RepID=A0A317WKB3_9EURO|nr:hypothetical protein BO94DRAFT_546732 [Aspergillus sclerotioniger CBS 115572]PWY86505.1 hypothetical protein BO94DRAFT_546732 [Aspergillus sclerotioniger CBS 115572]